MKLPEWMKLKPERDMDNLPTTSYPEISYEDFCDHQWREKLRSYAPPRKDVANIPMDDKDLASTLLMGVTTIIEECPICKSTRRESVLGNPDPQLDEMLDKVLEYGTQYMQRNGHTFFFQEYIPPAQPVGIPLR